MNLDKVRARPFLLLMISDAVEAGAMTPAHMTKLEGQLVDMSLKIAKGFFSPVISHDLKKSCSIVMGVATLGLLKLSDGDALKARQILLDDSVIICFRKGWESVDSLFKAHGSDADRASLLSHYQFKENEHKDIASIHSALLSEQLDVTLLGNIAATFTNPLSSMETYYQDEESIKADVQLAVFEALMKRHNIAHTQYDDLKDLLFSYRETPDVFADEYHEETTTILERLDEKASIRVEDWLPSIEEDLLNIFEVLAFENSGPEIYISFFDEILRGNINPNNFMHAYESLQEPEKQLHTSLKMQIDAESSYNNMLEGEDSELAQDFDLSEYGNHTAIDY